MGKKKRKGGGKAQQPSIPHPDGQGKEQHRIQAGVESHCPEPEQTSSTIQEATAVASLVQVSREHCSLQYLLPAPVAETSTTTNTAQAAKAEQPTLPSEASSSADQEQTKCQSLGATPKVFLTGCKSQQKSAAALAQAGKCHTGAGKYDAAKKVQALFQSVDETPKLQPPQRNGPGKTGNEGVTVPLEANLYTLTVRTQQVYHYDVEIEPQVKAKPLFNKIVTDFLQTTKPFQDYWNAYVGGRSFYTARQIVGLDHARNFPFSFLEPGSDDTRTGEYQLTIQPAGDSEINFAPLNKFIENGSSFSMPAVQLQILDIVLKHVASAEPNVAVIRNSFFSREKGVLDLGGGIEIWRGHYQSVRPVCWKVVLNLDVTQKAFLKLQRIHEYMKELYRPQSLKNGLTSEQHKDFEHQLRGVKVSYKRGGYTAKKMVSGLAGPANRERLLSNQNMTVQKYFESKYRIKLSYPHLPCVRYGPTNQKCLVPVEICTILPKQEAGKLTEIQSGKMIKYAAVSPDERYDRIQNMRNELPLANNPLLNDFGILISDRMIQLSGRMLKAPMLCYKNDGRQPKSGVWDLRGLKFVTGARMQQWGILYLEGHMGNNPDLSYQELDRFVDVFIREGNRLEMDIKKPVATLECDFTEAEIQDKLHVLKKEHCVEIILVVIRYKGDPLYFTVKTIGDLKLNLPTQCISRETVRGRNGRGPDMKSVANICNELNVRLGGVNLFIGREHRAKCMMEDQIMFMGADVTHPTPGQLNSNRPSIAGVVGSMDPRASQYCAEIRLQQSRQEVIEHLDEMVQKLLWKFHKKNRNTSTGKPNKIIFYRDGVSEGQFEQVLNHELRAIQKACRSLGDDYRPEITFIVVQKRHHVRFFRTEPDRANNLPAGTVVDTEVVHPTELDFYMTSHAAVQGTSKPTHYRLLYDDSEFSANTLQLMTFYLCFMYSRCTRSVSYPAPCYYAHLVADRGRRYYDELIKNRMSADEGEIRAELQREIDRADWSNFMYFT